MMRGGLGFLGVGGMTRREAREAVRDALGKPGLMVLTVADMARVTGVCEKTIRRRVDAGEIRSSSEFDGRRIRIPIDEAVRYCMV
jgi:excisionase family DNA binding protein